MVTITEYVTPLVGGARKIALQREAERIAIRRAHAVAARLLSETGEAGISFDAITELIVAETGMSVPDAAYCADELRAQGLARVDRKADPWMMYRTDLTVGT